MFAVTLANGFLIGKWKINLNHSPNKNILQTSTTIIIDHNSVTVENSNNGGELLGDYIITNNRMVINNVRITKIPSFTKLPKAMSNYKWIKLIQKQGIQIFINSFNETNLLLKYECSPYNGSISLKKIN